MPAVPAMESRLALAIIPINIPASITSLTGVSRVYFSDAARCFFKVGLV